MAELVCALPIADDVDDVIDDDDDGGGICEMPLALFAGCSVNDFRLDEINFNLLSFLLDADFCTFGMAILLSLISADIRAGLLSFLSDLLFVNVSLFELFDDDDSSSLDLVFDAVELSDFFASFDGCCGADTGWLTGMPDVFVV